MDEDDEFFGDQVATVSNELSTLNKVNKKLYNDGYRIGKVQQEEKEVQDSFDRGFVHGLYFGKVCGSFTVKLQLVLKTSGAQKSTIDIVTEQIAIKFPRSHSVDKDAALNSLRTFIIEVASVDIIFQLDILLADVALLLLP